jgi:hypothetical protein
MSEDFPVSVINVFQQIIGKDSLDRTELKMLC